MKKFLAPFLILTILATVTITIIAFGRGYRPNLTKRTISSTGLLAASSEPAGAEIFLDGKLTSATNTTLTLSPGWYQVKLVKEGYLPWEKKMKILGEVVSETKASLFPSTPSLSPLTTSGAIAPVLSPDGTKVAYAIPADTTKAGLWLLNINNSSPLNLSHDPVLLSPSTPSLDFSQGTFSWSPDSKQILVAVGSNYYLIDAEKGAPPVLISWDAAKTLVSDWQQQEKEKAQEKLVLLPPLFAKIATESGKILAFSPDETKVLYEATGSATVPQILESLPIASNSTPEVRKIKPGGIYVYDTKEDKNFALPSQTLLWFPSSRHLIMVEGDKISILDYDGINKATVYSGPFEKFVACQPSGGKLLILTSYNRPGLTNLYAINLR